MPRSSTQPSAPTKKTNPAYQGRRPQSSNWSALQRDGADLKRHIMGFRGLGAHEEVGFTADELKATEEFLHLRTTTIYGGSNEVQANIIAKRVLGLPD